MQKFAIVILMSWFAVGCASHIHQTDDLLRSPVDIPPRAEVPNVPFYKQSAGNCGPATLAMAMTWAGRPSRPEELESEVKTPASRGTLPQDMVSAPRRHGMMGIKIEGLSSVLKEVAAGHPVIIFENLALSWLPQWHYAIVTGYDLEHEQIIMNSGPEVAKHWDLHTFERSWIYSDYWALVVLPAGKLASAGGDELANLAATAGLEQLGENREAQMGYRAVLRQWPRSLGALIGLGNIAYKDDSAEEAIKYFSLAYEYHPSSQAARHNLEVAKKKLTFKEDGRPSSDDYAGSSVPQTGSRRSRLCACDPNAKPAPNLTANH